MRYLGVERAEIDTNNGHCLRIKNGRWGEMVVRYEDRQGVVSFCAAIAVEFFYEPVAEEAVQIGHVLEPSRNFQMDAGLHFSRMILQGKTKRKHTKLKRHCLRSDLLVPTVLGRSSDEQNRGLLLVRIVLAGLGRTAEHAIGDHHQDVDHAQNNTDTAS